jgi:hypothetical protein
MQPIIPVRRKEPFDDDGWHFELKLDGFRGLADTVHGRMLSKNGERTEKHVKHAPATPCRPRQPDEVVQRRLHRQWTTGESM